MRLIDGISLLLLGKNISLIWLKLNPINWLILIINIENLQFGKNNEFNGFLLSM